MSDLDEYAWADSSRDPSLEALSLTVVEPADDGYLALLVPRERLPRDLTVAEALGASLSVDDFAWGSVLVQTDTLEGWTVFVEPNGWATSDTDVLARLSHDGRAVNVFWNVNAVMSFAVAKAGVLVRQFDPLLYDIDDDRLPEEAVLPFGEPGRVRAASLALLNQLTGLRIEPAWILERRRPTYIVPLALPTG
jgi:hypothetical protein